MRPASVLATIALALACSAPALAQTRDEQLDAELRQLRDLFTRRLSDRAVTWRCDVLTRFICTAKGCEQPPPSGLWIVLDFAQGRYERCDAKGCDRYRLETAASGIFTAASPGVERAGFLKVVNDGTEFVETMSLGLAAYMSFGRCTATVGR